MGDDSFWTFLMNQKSQRFHWISLTLDQMLAGFTFARKIKIVNDLSFYDFLNLFGSITVIEDEADGIGFLLCLDDDASVLAIFVSF